MVCSPYCDVHKYGSNAPLSTQALSTYQHSAVFAFALFVTFVLQTPANTWEGNETTNLWVFQILAQCCG
jgi:hypothetical protein